MFGILVARLDAKMQGSRTSIQFLQELTSHISHSKEASGKVHQGLPGGSEAFAIMLQVYRQRVTHLASEEGSGSKDEKEQRRECKAEFPARNVAAAALPRLTKLHRFRGLLLLNPVTNRQFLTLLSDVSRLKIIAEVANKVPSTIHYVKGNGSIEDRAMF